MFYTRYAFLALKEALPKQSVLVLTGMRRTGKTAILRQLYSETLDNKIFLDLENRINHEAFLLADYDQIWGRLRENFGLDAKKMAYVFLDEVQNLPVLPSIVKYLVDHYKVKFVLTGSASFYLKNLFSESLSGRKRLFELFPLTFCEFLVFKGRKTNLPIKSFDLGNIKKIESDQALYQTDYEEYLRFGGFPGVVMIKNEAEKTLELKEILYSYIDQDVKKLADFSKIEALESLVRLLASRVGQKLQVEKLSGEIGLARETVNNYLDFLEKTYLIARIAPFSKSPDRELSKAKKLYFCDSGMANVLGQLSAGQLLENAIFNNLRVKYQFDKAFTGINFFQKKSGVEIDFMLEDKYGIEVKVTAGKSDWSKLVRLTSELKIKSPILISQNKTVFPGAIYASQV